MCFVAEAKDSPGLKVNVTVFFMVATFSGGCVPYAPYVSRILAHQSYPTFSRLISVFFAFLP